MWFWNDSQKSTFFYKPLCLKLLDDTSPCTDTVFLPSHYYREVQFETQIHELADVTSLNKWTHFKWLAHFKDWCRFLYFCLNINIILMVFNFFLLIHHHWELDHFPIVFQNFFFTENGFHRNNLRSSWVLSIIFPLKTEQNAPIEPLYAYPKQ